MKRLTIVGVAILGILILPIWLLVSIVLGEDMFDWLEYRKLLKGKR